MKTAAHPFRPEHGALHVRRQIANYLSIGLTTCFAAAALFFLGYLIYYVTRQGIQYLNVDYFTQPPAAEGEKGGGIYPAIIGSLSIVGYASAIGIPLGLFTGIYLSEFGHGRIGVVVAAIVNLLTGLPTIIFGLFAWILIVVPEQHFSGFSGAVALSIIMIPYVARATEEVLRLVPKELREGSVALGATESRTILRVVLPAASSGIVTGILLAVARVAGETAPLLFTAFGNNFSRINFFSNAIDAIPLRVYKQTTDPFTFVNDQAFAGAFVLLLMVLVTSFLVRWATGGFKQR